MISSTLKSVSGIMSGAFGVAVLTVLVVEATVLLLGGMLHDEWRGAALMAFFGAAWVADIFIGRWVTRRPEVVAQRARYSLVIFATMIALYTIPQALSWFVAEQP